MKVRKNKVKVEPEERAQPTSSTCISASTAASGRPQNQYCAYERIRSPFPCLNCSDEAVSPVDAIRNRAVDRSSQAAGWPRVSTISFVQMVYFQPVRCQPESPAASQRRAAVSR